MGGTAHGVGVSFLVNAKSCHNISVSTICLGIVDVVIILNLCQMSTALA